MECEALTVALTLRMPIWKPEELVAASFKVAQLESYLLLTAYQVGELASERHDRAERLRDLDQQWDALEAFGRQRTKADVESAKRTLNPELHDDRAQLGYELEEIEREISRLDRDATRAKQAYDMLGIG